MVGLDFFSKTIYLLVGLDFFSKTIYLLVGLVFFSKTIYLLVGLDFFSKTIYYHSECQKGQKLINSTWVRVTGTTHSIDTNVTSSLP